MSARSSGKIGTSGTPRNRENRSIPPFLLLFPEMNKKAELAVRHCLLCQVVKPYEVKAPTRMT